RPRGVDAVLPGDRLEPGELLEAGFAQALVPTDVVGGARRLAVLAEVGGVERQHLALEAAFGPRPPGALLRSEAERVAVGAGDAPLVRDALRAFELRGGFVAGEVR